MTLVIFHRSIRRPMKTLTCTTKLVSLSNMYSSTTRDWKTPNMMERTDKPSRDCLLFQNWMSEGETELSSSVLRAVFECRYTSGELTILKGKKLKDAVHNGDNNSETQQVGVGFQKGHLFNKNKISLLKIYLDTWNHRIYLAAAITKRQEYCLHASLSRYLEWLITIVQHHSVLNVQVRATKGKKTN